MSEQPQCTCLLTRTDHREGCPFAPRRQQLRSPPAAASVEPEADDLLREHCDAMKEHYGVMSTACNAACELREAVIKRLVAPTGPVEGEPSEAEWLAAHLRAVIDPTHGESLYDIHFENGTSLTKSQIERIIKELEDEPEGARGMESMARAMSERNLQLRGALVELADYTEDVLRNMDGVVWPEGFPASHPVLGRALAALASQPAATVTMSEDATPELKEALGKMAAAATEEVRQKLTGVSTRDGGVKKITESDTGPAATEGEGNPMQVPGLPRNLADAGTATEERGESSLFEGFIGWLDRHGDNHGVAKAYEKWKAELDAAPATEERGERPNIICLCGSSRFVDVMAVLAWELEKQGNVVLSLHLLPAWYTSESDHQAEAEGVADAMDELHLRKIDMADEVIVVDVGGYVGESTTREIQHTKNTGTGIRYFSKELDLLKLVDAPASPEGEKQK